MSQAERESSESAERITEPFTVHPGFSTQDLLEEADFRIDMVRGFLNLLSCGSVGQEGFEEDVEAVAWGSVKLLDEAKALRAEHEERIFERERPRREAAEKRRKKAQARERCVRMFAKLEVDKGADKATARLLAKETVAELEAKGPLFVEAAPAAPANGNGGVQ